MDEVKKGIGKTWKLRPEWAGNEYRYLYRAVVGQRYAILHALQKKTQKWREREIATAEQRYEEIKRRIADEEVVQDLDDIADDRNDRRGILFDRDRVRFLRLKRGYS